MPLCLWSSATELPPLSLLQKLNSSLDHKDKSAPGQSAAAYSYVSTMPLIQAADVTVLPTRGEAVCKLASAIDLPFCREIGPRLPTLHEPAALKLERCTCSPRRQVIIPAIKHFMMGRVASQHNWIQLLLELEPLATE